MKLSFKRESLLLLAVLTVYVLYFTAIIYFSVKVETVVFFRLITQSRLLLFALFALFSLMLFIVIYNIVQIVVDRYRNKEGARFRLRLTLYFLIITSIPLVPLSVVSNNFISKSISLWFVSGIEESLNEAMGVSKVLYGWLSRESREEWEKKCRGCTAADLKNAAFEFIDGVVARGEEGVQVLYARNVSLAVEMSSFDLESINVESWKRVPVQENEYLLVPVRGAGGSSLFVVRKVDDSLKSSTLSISLGLQNYRVLKVVRKPIRVIMTLVFVVVTMPFVLLAFFLGLLVSKGVTTPISELAIATQKIAEGDLDYRIGYRAKDELRMLIGSFNSMIEELRMNRELLKFSERSAAWQDIAQKIAHEIKNPLTPIKLSAERLLKLYQKEDQFRDVLSKGVETIITEVNNITNMVNEFSNFARFPASRLERVDIIPLLTEIVDSLTHSYKNVRFSFHHKEESVYLLMDGGQMRRAVLNIVYNGINALAGSGGEGQIGIESFTPKGRKDHYTVSITDNGVGIENDIKEMIFKPYFSKDGKGSGLGLPIAEKITFENKGRIWFESRSGKTTFYLELPKA